MIEVQVVETLVMLHTLENNTKVKNANQRIVNRHWCYVAVYDGSHIPLRLFVSPPNQINKPAPPTVLSIY